MQVPVYNLAGEVVKNIDISDAVFAVPFNEGVIHQVMVAQRANARQGTSSTKTRGEVSGSSRKLFRQKGTGSARAGSRKSPLRRGGGITFGPHPRDYRQDIPKKMRHLALRSVLSAKIGDEELKIMGVLKFDEPKTWKMTQLLNALGINSPALVVTSGPEESVILSARNLTKIKTMPANLLNVLDILSYKMLVITEDAVREVERLWEPKTVSRGNHAPV